MKKFLLTGLLGTVLIGMSGCTEIQKDSKEDIKTSVTVSLYSNNGEILKKYADKNMKVDYSNGGTVALYFSDKKVIMCNVQL